MLTKKAVEHGAQMKKSLEVSAARLDVYLDFKVWCVKSGITIQEGLDRAIRMVMKGGK